MQFTLLRKVKKEKNQNQNFEGNKFDKIKFKKLLIWRLTQSQLCRFLTVTSDLMQEQPTLEMVSAGSDTQETSSLNKSFNIRLMRDS